MFSCELTRLSECQYDVTGVLDFDTVPKILKQSEAFIGYDGTIEIDLAQVSKSNSAGLALLIEWKSLALSGGYNVVFSNVPEQIMRLAEVSKIEGILS